MKISEIFKNSWSWMKTNKVLTVFVLFLLWFYVDVPSYTAQQAKKEAYRDYVQSIQKRRGSSENLLFEKSIELPELASDMSVPSLPSVSRSMKVASSSYQVTNSGKKIIKSSSLQIEVGDTEKMAGTVRNMVNTYKGFVENSSSYSDGKGGMTYHFSIKVPEDKFYEAVDNFKKIGKVLSENYRSSDVTEQYSDIENELKNLIARRDRLRKLMETKTENLKDVLEVDRELSKVQNQVENLVRRKRNMEKSINYSSLNITLKQKQTIKEVTLGWSLGGSVNFYINALLGLGEWILDKAIFIGIFTPAWLLAFGCYWVYRKIKMRIKTKKIKEDLE